MSERVLQPRKFKEYKGIEPGNLFVVFPQSKGEPDQLSPRPFVVRVMEVGDGDVLATVIRAFGTKKPNKQSADNHRKGEVLSIDDNTLVRRGT